MGDDLDYQKELIRQQQDPSHDQSAFKVDVVCPFTGDEYVTTTPQYSYTFSGDNLTYTIDGINEPAQEFVTHLPTMEKIEKMCEQYPGLKKAYEHFVFAYKLIRQDYDGKVKAGELDD